jgi:hypothetical protein
MISIVIAARATAPGIIEETVALPRSAQAIE